MSDKINCVGHDCPACKSRAAEPKEWETSGRLTALRKVKEFVDAAHADAERDLYAVANEKGVIREQEPVEWTDEQMKMLNFLYGAGDFDGVWFDQRHPAEKGAFWWRKHLRRLFDRPVHQTTQEPVEHCLWARNGNTPCSHVQPKHEWQGLTDDLIFDLAEPFGAFEYGDAQGHKRLEFARAIEAKCKEKNNG